MKLNRLIIPYFLVICLALLLNGCKKDPLFSDTGRQSVLATDSVELLKLNELQILGSHNSYRIRTYQPLFDFLQSLSSLFPPDLKPDGLDYSHLPLEAQFNMFHIRSIELDIYNDPDGGRYYQRQGNRFIGEPTASGIPELMEPGFKILHIPDFDYMAHYFTFKQALETVKRWSDQNPRHIPLIIMVETKSSTIADVIGFPGLTSAVPYDLAAADAIDEEIKSAFGTSWMEKIITPDDIRQDYNTLEEAVLHGNWPTLKESRGKVLFVMQGGLVSYYKQNHPSLQGRIMFVFAEPGEPEAAFVIRNEPLSDGQEIMQLVKQGYIVRTRADADTREARNGDYSRWEAALNSGAHIISTDYYLPDPRYKTQSGWTDYHVKLPDGVVARVNPVSAPEKTGLGVITE